MKTLAIPDDVQIMWRSLSDEEAGRVQQLIDIASFKLRQKAPFDIDARIALYETDPSDRLGIPPMVVANVVAGIVKRFLVNEAGVATTTETVGPYSLSQSYVNRYDKSGGDIRGSIQVTDADIDELRPATPTRIPGAIQLVPTKAMQPPSAWLTPGHLDPVTGDPRFGYGAGTANSSNGGPA